MATQDGGEGRPGFMASARIFLSEQKGHSGCIDHGAQSSCCSSQVSFQSLLSVFFSFLFFVCFVCNVAAISYLPTHLSCAGCLELGQAQSNPYDVAWASSSGSSSSSLYFFSTVMVRASRIRGAYLVFLVLSLCRTLKQEKKKEGRNSRACLSSANRQNGQWKQQKRGLDDDDAMGTTRATHSMGV